MLLLRCDCGFPIFYTLHYCTRLLFIVRFHLFKKMERFHYVWAMNRKWKCSPLNFFLSNRKVLKLIISWHVAKSVRFIIIFWDTLIICVMSHVVWFSTNILFSHQSMAYLSAQSSHIIFPAWNFVNNLNKKSFGIHSFTAVPYIAHIFFCLRRIFLFVKIKNHNHQSQKKLFFFIFTMLTNEYYWINFNKWWFKIRRKI